MKWAYLAAAGVAVLMVLTGCEVERGGPPLAGQLPSASPQACPRIYNPVCASRYGDRRTFPNACEAQSSGYRVRFGGQCRAIGGPDDGQGGGQVCPMIYQPVCARRGGDTRTFPNSCRAESSGYNVLYQSECLGRDAARGSQDNTGNGGGDDLADGGASGSAGTGMSAGGLKDQKPGGGQSCSRTFVPVCGAKGGEKKTFINACMAQSKGYSVAAQGRCP